ncbi:NAD kinase [Mesobacillus maritimus]|uniref:NAD kinase n=1 Tax=Mesobacillus maritimus TaxID=1643336 RepID=UPI0020421F36|nr:NAD kinase [Mesobacillus maritimus]MCM3587888.1 NAD kinase [Mesobacillus maritimus]MCM3670062.1 NAD kinase [Mesobacillus maritimus]
MPDRRKLYFYHKPDPETKEIVAPLYNLATRSKFDLVKDYRSANIIVSIGDDDTFLQAVRNTGFRDDCLYTGVSFTDKRSMYCDFQLNNLSSIIDAMTNDNLEVRRYPTIDVKIDEETSFQCLNEFSVRSSIIRTFVMDVFIDQLHFETFRGNGMIVSTPTGSTGYTRSVNGSIVDPLIPCLQVSEVASLNTNDYRSLGSSFILAGGRKLTLKVVQDGNDYPIMGIDNEALSIQHVEKIEVQLSNKQVKTLKLKDNSFWEKVRRTFL